MRTSILASTRTSTPMGRCHARINTITMTIYPVEGGKKKKGKKEDQDDALVGPCYYF